MALLKPSFFATPKALRDWLAEHHADARELLVGFRRKDSGIPSITWPEAVDQALCFGWIDGVRKRVDDDSYCIRFSPRKRGSTWSAVNIERVAELRARRLMKPAGVEAFEQRSEKKSRTYSYEQPRSTTLDAGLEKELRSNAVAWTFFQAQAPSYRRKVVHWVASAKQEETRLERLGRVIDAFAAGRRL